MSAINGVTATPRKIIQAQYRQRQAKERETEKALASIAREFLLHARTVEQCVVWFSIPDLEGDEVTAAVKLLLAFERDAKSMADTIEEQANWGNRPITEDESRDPFDSELGDTEYP